MEAVAKALAATTLSQGLREHAWVVATLQSLHILALALLLGSAFLLLVWACRGFAGEFGASDLRRRFGPAILAAWLTLTATGILQVLAEPERTLTNPVFAFKLALVTTATLALILTLRGRLSAFGLFTAFALLLATSVAGRFIAYADFVL